MIVPELEGPRAQQIVVLEGDADRETFVKRWTSGDKHVRAVVQSTGVSTEEEDLDDSEEVEGEDLPRSDRSSEDEEEEEGMRMQRARERKMKMRRVKRKMTTQKMRGTRMIQKVTMMTRVAIGERVL